MTVLLTFIFLKKWSLQNYLLCLLHDSFLPNKFLDDTGVQKILFILMLSYQTHMTINIKIIKKISYGYRWNPGKKHVTSAFSLSLPSTSSAVSWILVYRWFSFSALWLTVWLSSKESALDWISST